LVTYATAKCRLGATTESSPTGESTTRSSKYRIRLLSSLGLSRRHVIQFAGITILREFVFPGCRARLSLFYRFVRGANVNLALKESPVCDADAWGRHVAGQRPLAANVQPVGGVDVANNLALDHDFASRDDGGNGSAAANRDPVSRKVDGTFNSAVDVERFGA